MKLSTVAFVVGALVVAWLIMRRRISGVVSVGGARPGGIGSIPTGGMIPTTNAPQYGQPTSGAQDFNQYAQGITSLIGGLTNAGVSLYNAGVFSSSGSSSGSDSIGGSADSSYDVGGDFGSDSSDLSDF